MLLSEVKQGQTVRICALKDSSQEFLHYLNRQQIKLGTVLEILRIEEFDKSIKVEVQGLNTMLLSHDVSNRLLVENV